MLLSPAPAVFVGGGYCLLCNKLVTTLSLLGVWLSLAACLCARCGCPAAVVILTWVRCFLRPPVVFLPFGFENPAPFFVPKSFVFVPKWGFFWETGCPGNPSNSPFLFPSFSLSHICPLFSSLSLSFKGSPHL